MRLPHVLLYEIIPLQVSLKEREERLESIALLKIASLSDLLQFQALQLEAFLDKWTR